MAMLTTVGSRLRIRSERLAPTTSATGRGPGHNSAIARTTIHRQQCIAAIRSSTHCRNSEIRQDKFDHFNTRLVVPMMAVATRMVAEDEADIRLDRWFRRHFPGLTQGAIQKLCRTGQVRVDGRRADAATRLAAGQSVRVPPLPAAPEPKARPEVEPDAARDVQRLVIHRDDHLLVLNK